ncbi:MAG: kinase [Patescibacteria group bacterium]
MNNGNGGMTISTTINRYCYITARHLPPFFDHKYRIRYTRREERSAIENIEHPSVRECMKYLDFRDHLEMVHTSDLPAMAGLGSSSAFTVGFLNSLHGLRGKTVRPRDLALQAIHVEQNLIGENVGSQDQVATAVGGLNRIVFRPSGIKISSLSLSPRTLKTLEGRLLLYFTGFQRFASEIAAEQIKNTPDKTQELNAMMHLAKRAEADLLAGSIGNMGALLDEGWQIKKTLSSKITDNRIDAIYARARSAGAVGGKLLGAGGGGFFLLYAPEQKHAKIRAALSDLIHVPFHFENTGSKIIYQNI